MMTTTMTFNAYIYTHCVLLLVVPNGFRSKLLKSKLNKWQSGSRYYAIVVAVDDIHGFVPLNSDGVT